MSEQSKFDRLLEKYPHGHQAFFNRPHLTRRRFFQMTGAGVSGAFLARRLADAADGTSAGVVTKNTAKNVIFILLAGAPSQTDTFDFKSVNVAPNSFAPATTNGVLWPMGLLPKLGGQLSDFAIVRSMRAHALAHALSQTWTQIGRNPLGALGSVAPNIGSVVAIEKDKERLPTQAFPTFVALNSNGAAGAGYLKAKYARSARGYGTRPLSAAFRILRRRRGKGRTDHRVDECHGLGCCRLRLVAPALCVHGRCGGKRPR
jgi:hypothetical protein